MGEKKLSLFSIFHILGTGLLNEIDNLRNLLKKYFRLIADYSKDIYSVDDGFSKQTEKEFKEYKSYQFVEVIQWSTISLSRFVSYVDEYLKANTLWFDFFHSLTNSLGIDKYHDILDKEIRLDTIKLENIDLDFVRYNVGSNVAFVFPKIKELFFTLLSELKDLPSILKIIRSEIADQFVTDLEETLKRWLTCHDELQFLFEEALQDSSPECVNKLMSIFENLIGFAENFLKITSYFNPFDKNWKEYDFKDFLKILDRFNEIQKDLKLLLDVRREAYEHSAKFNEQIPTALWGDRETGLKMFESFVRFEIPTDNLIPKEFRVQDLAFILIQARTELNIVDQAMKLEKEKIYVLQLATELLKSKTFQILYDGIIKRLEIANKYTDLLYQNLDELQKETQKLLKSKVNKH